MCFAESSIQPREGFAALELWIAWMCRLDRKLGLR